MKRKTIWSLILTIAVSVFFCLVGVACGGGNGGGVTLTLSHKQYAMDLYEEYQLTADGVDGVTWSSSDESIVKVTADGLLIAQGVKGDATVTATGGGVSATCKVAVRNQRNKAVLKSSELRAFVAGLSSPELAVQYKFKDYTPESVTLTSLDTAVAVIEDGQVKGVTVGEAEISVSAQWKGQTLTSSFVATVYPEQIMFLADTQVQLYDVVDGLEVKHNSYTVSAEVFHRGVKVENPTLTLTATQNAEYVTVDGATVKVAKMPTVDGVDVTLSVVNEDTGVTLDETLTVKVLPNYIVKDPLKELIETTLASIEIKTCDGEVGGRTGVVDYTVTNHSLNVNATNNAWAHWNTHLIFTSTQTLNGVTAYTAIKDAGYKLLSFDIYYTGQNGMFFGVYGYSSYFYVNVQNNREDMLLVNADGEITNTLQANQWMTVYLDMDALINGATVAGKSDCNMFVSCNGTGDTCYIDDVRYWFDTAVLDGYTNKLDLAPRTLIADTENAAKAIAPENEFIVYSPDYVSFAAAEKDGVNCYRYDSANALAYDNERRSKINAYNDLNGAAVKKGYKWFVFDILVEQGAPYMKCYDLILQKEITVDLKDNAAISTYGVRFFSDGNEIREFVTGEWVSVAVQIDGKAKENFYITSRTPSVFYVKNGNYYKDGSYEYDYAQNEWLKAYDDNVEAYYYVGESAAVKDMLDVRFKGETVDDYTVTSVEFAQDIAQYANGNVTFKGAGVAYVSVTLQKDTHSATLQFALHIYDVTRIELPTEAVELYCGDTDLFAKSYEASAYGYENKLPVERDRLIVDCVSGSEYIVIDGLTVTANAVGEATVWVGFESANGDRVGKEMQITVFDTFRARGNDEFVWGNRSNTEITYGVTDETVGERTGVAKYYSRTSNSWNDRLMIYESGHAIKGDGVGVTIPYGSATAAFENLTAKNIQYITFDLYLTAGSYLRIQAPDKTGEADKRIDYATAAYANQKDNNENISLYRQGGLVEGNIIAADTWYTVVIDHKTAKCPSWSAIFVNGYGTVYLDNVRYYHDIDWMYDCAYLTPPERIETAKEAYALWLPEIGDATLPSEVEIEATVFVRNQAVSDAKFTVVGMDGDENVVELVDGTTLKAKAKGTAIVKIAYEADESIFAEVPVTVYGEYAEKDGSELLLAKQQNSTYGATTATVGGRTGVYAFVNTASACWNDRLAVYESSHPYGTSNTAIPHKNSVDAFANMMEKRYRYVTVDVYLTAGSGIKVSSVNSAGKYATNRYHVGSSLNSALAAVGHTANDCITLYKNGVAVGADETITANCWYTVVVDLENATAPADSSVWSAIDFAGCYGSIYFDTVRYCFVNPVV